ncbi:helix-turn-helix transcriptional regulator [Streptomyces beijiangensis]|uniref:Helix-turn-helix domain-containing protein n=1 Tax=Streptomyces beijiangensis TaxID=163361 RepID=A0A939FBT8_9ACTN|nr:helix-turn-helix transcriptional regulator [Streptomyces beijiangensis]MBO0514155.1 helix-turn-helix domain-containing protein [Streptomyces beijiangensis]
MDSNAALGEFLRSRRSRIKPEDVGVASYGMRRVPGLRREELAQLAGVSVTYYTRLEQGQSTRASESVIESLARALSLSEAERAHLHELARPAPSRPRKPAKPARARQGLRLLLDAVGDVPAIVLGVRHEILAWNPLGHLLLAGHLDAAAPSRAADRPNLTRMLFLDPHSRDLYVRWQDEARCAVAALRVIVGRHRDDPELVDLVGELSMNSTEFTMLWSKHTIASHVAGIKQFQHPEVGALELRYESLLLPDDSGHRVLMYFADRGTPSEAALQLLQSRSNSAADASVSTPVPEWK